MSDFEEQFSVALLPYGSKAPVFTRTHVMLDPLRDSAGRIKEKLAVRAFIIHGAQILDDHAVVRSFVIPGCPLVVIQCSPTFEENDNWMKNPNYLARLVNANVSVECALVSLSRSYWQQGYTQFLDAATFLRNLVDETGTHDYQRRSEVVCLSFPRKELMPATPFNEHSGNLLLSPALQGDPTGGKYVGEWIDKIRTTISHEEAASMVATAQRMKKVQPYLNASAKALVRIFGYHSLNHDEPLGSCKKFRVVACSGFFISPRHILTTRTAKYHTQSQTFAHRFTFSRNVRAMHGMLREGIDLFDCVEVRGQVDYIVDSIRSIGVELPEGKIPAGLNSATWCDFLLLEVVDRRSEASDTEYLLPELLENAPIKRGDDLFTLHFPNRPDDDFLDSCFGTRGFNKKFSAVDLGMQFWDFNIKSCSCGSALDDCTPLRTIQHNCSMLPGSRGAPVIRSTHVEFENDAAKMKKIGEDSLGLDFACTYCAVSIGRSTELMERDRDNIISMSTSDLARIESLGVNMHNVAAIVTHTSLILSYIKYIAPCISNADHRAHLHKFLNPYMVLVTKDILMQCHRKMLKDADEFNEYGMDFYDHQDIESSLACFREGAKMFSTANIPNLSQHEIELKSALQTNVASVVVAKWGK